MPPKTWFRVDGKGDAFLGRKEVDKSAFRSAITNPGWLTNRCLDAYGPRPEWGTASYPLKLLFENGTSSPSFKITSNHGNDLVQIQYKVGSESTDECIKALFPQAYAYVLENDSRRIKRQRDDIPEDIAGYLDFYRHSPGVFRVEVGFPDAEPEACQTAHTSVHRSRLPEEELERLLAMPDEDFTDLISLLDQQGRLQLKEHLSKIRQGSRKVFDHLKLRYNYTCQLCGWKCPQDAGVNVIEVHHIRPFIVSLDNSPSNLVVLCPNCHAMVHAAEAVFACGAKEFVCRNRHRIPLKHNRHL